MELLRYAACYGRGLLSKHTHRPALRGYGSPAAPSSLTSAGAFPTTRVHVLGGELRDGSLLRSRQVQKIARDAGRSLAAPGGADVSGTLCVQTMHSHVTTGLLAVGETLGPDHWFSSGSVALRRNCPEVRGHRELDFIGILALSRGVLSGSFLRFPSSGVSRGHKFPGRRARRGPISGEFCADTSLVGVHSLGARHDSGQVSLPLQKIVLPSIGPLSGCTGYCATKPALLCGYSKNCASTHCGPSARMLFAECDPFCALQAYFEGVKASLSLFLHRATSTSSLWTA